jgi:hypothetical protein
MEPHKSTFNENWHFQLKIKAVKITSVTNLQYTHFLNAFYAIVHNLLTFALIYLGYKSIVTKLIHAMQINTEYRHKIV